LFQEILLRSVNKSEAEEVSTKSHEVQESGQRGKLGVFYQHKVPDTESEMDQANESQVSTLGEDFGDEKKLRKMGKALPPWPFVLEGSGRNRDPFRIDVYSINID